MEAALGVGLEKDVGFGVAGKALPSGRPAEAETERMAKELLGENKKGTDKLDSIDKQLKDGITVNMSVAQMS